ncbi:MAG: hypothetical protein H6Q74_1883 [Firmicutes bacterium]|nr:hypothetical protein [Bacillota bacterium]
MKKILVVLILLLCCLPSAIASLNDVNIKPDKSQIAVVLFMDKHILADGKTVAKIRNALNEKFKAANSVVIYGDDQAKSPEFLEFAEKVKTDPANEKDIRVVNIGELARYARSINSDYVMLITISPFNVYDNFWSGIRVDMKENVAVIDVASQKYVEYLSWYKEGTSPWMDDGAKDLINQLVANFYWTPPNELSDNKSCNQVGESKPAVVVFMSDIILEKPELVEKVRKTISEKFQVSEVPINGDNKPKSPEFLELIGKVETNSAKQQTFILKKANLVDYGRATNSNPVIAIDISNVGAGDYDFNYHLKADIFVVDPGSNKYLSNVVFDTIDAKKRQDGLDFLMSKIQNEFMLP